MCSNRKKNIFLDWAVTQRNVFHGVEKDKITFDRKGHAYNSYTKCTLEASKITVSDFR
jgi:hypothetical protein